MELMASPSNGILRMSLALAAVLIFFGRLFLNLIEDGFAAYIAPFAFLVGIAAAYIPMPSHFLQVVAMLGSFAIAGKGAIALFRHAGPVSGYGAGSSRHPVSGGAVKSRWLADARRWIPAYAGMTIISLALFLFTLILPFLPFASRYVMDVAIMVLTYIMLAWGLNITVGYAGLLDLGYVGFYALGAYSYALLENGKLSEMLFGWNEYIFALLGHYFTDISFWAALPIAGLIAAGTGFLLGFPVLRLRGDYFAIVTLGFGEIVRLVLTNWTGLTNGPNGISGIPRPTLFGLDFAREPAVGQQAFNEFFHLDFNPMQRVIFFYYIILVLALLTGLLGSRLRRLPLGRAWEAFREDEIAIAALGVSRTRIKLAAYSLGAMVAGIAGAFFAARQGFISPESFTFNETAIILAIVILGGVGHPLGIVMAAVFIIGLPELFRELEQYRMLAFGAGMVLIMIWRPGGLMAVREPTIRVQGSGFGVQENKVSISG